MCIEDLNEPGSMKKVMQKIQECVAYETSRPTLMENLGRHSETNESSFENALNTSIIRLCEPCYKINEMPLEQEKSCPVAKLDLQTGKLIYAKLLPCTVGEVASLFLPADFQTSSTQKLNSVWEGIPDAVWQPGMFEDVVQECMVHKELEKALKTIENCSLNIASHNEEHLFEKLVPKVSSEPNIQIGLLTLSEEYLPLPIVDVIVPMEASKQSKIIENIGTFAMARLVKLQHLEAQDLTETFCVDQLRQERLNENKAVVEEIASNLKICPIKFEMTSFSNFPPVEKGLLAAKNFTLAKKFGVSTEDVVKYMTCQMNHSFEMNSVQMPFLTVARRISNPIIVKKTLIHELSQSFDNTECIGMKVLLNILENSSYEVRNIEDFIAPSDLLHDNIEKENAVVSQCTQLLSTGGYEEVMQLLDAEKADYIADFKDGVMELVLNLQLPVHHQKNTILDSSKNLEIFNNIQGQSCLYDMAEQLSSSLFVKHVLTSEAIKSSSFPQTPGYIALSKVLEKVHVQHESVQTLLSSEPFGQNKIEHYTSTCKKIEEILAYAQE